MLVISWLFPGLKKTSRILNEAAMAFSVLAVTLYFVLPVSILGAAVLSEKISRPVIQEAHRDFTMIQDELSSDKLSQQLFPEKENTDLPWYAPFMVSDHVDEIKDRLTSFKAYFSSGLFWDLLFMK